MRSVPELAWVLAALPLAAALGSAVALLASPRPALRHWHRTQVLALALVAGLLVDHALAVLVSTLRWVALGAFAIAAGSLAWALSSRRRALRDMLAIGWLRWLLLAAILLAFAGPILFEPLQDWDARSIWFFGAKRIFFDGGLADASAWTLPAYEFSHPDYPKLLPLLAAQFAQGWGVWNEYIPKASLLLLLAPVVAALAGLSQRIGLALGALAFVLLLSTRQYLWNGYADTYLALFGVLSLLYFARWLGSSSALNLALAGAFLGVAVNLKNEGALLALCIAVALAGWRLTAAASPPVAPWRGWPSGVWIALLLPWVGFAGWTLTKQHWQLTNDLQLGAGSAQRFVQRLGEGQLPVILNTLVLRSDAGRAAGLLLLAAGLARVLRTPLPASAWFPAAVALLYCAGLCVIYLATPNDVAWHLSTSADRTIVLAAFGFLGSTFLVLEAMEGVAADGRAPAAKTGLQT
ncbi:MAG: hypothetical protein NVS3B2_12210 [Ramlibacter sp.]